MNIKKLAYFLICVVFVLLLVSCSHAQQKAESTYSATPTKSVTENTYDENEVQEAFEGFHEIYVKLDKHFVDLNKVEPIALSQEVNNSIAELIPHSASRQNLKSEFQLCTQEVKPSDDENLFECLLTAYSSLNLAQQVIDPQEIYNTGAISMLTSLENRYTSYLTPDQYKSHTETIQGEYEGIGAFVAEDPDSEYLILKPIPNAPAEKAGILANDRVVKVNGQDIAGLPIEEVTKIVRGPKGTTVSLTIERTVTGMTVRKDITIKRDSVQIPSVEFMVISSQPYGYIKINSFDAKTSDDLEEALKNITKSNLKGLIVDLRFNPGGLLDATVESASLLLDKDDIVLYWAHNQEDIQTISTSRAQSGKYTSLPVVILVNNFSASGSEVFSSALRDNKRAILIGETTFGKGTVTTTVPLNTGSALNVASALWYTPNNNLIETVGIQPDIIIEQPIAVELLSEGDAQFLKAIEELERISS